MILVTSIPPLHPPQVTMFTSNKNALSIVRPFIGSLSYIHIYIYIYIYIYDIQGSLALGPSS